MSTTILAPIQATKGSPTSFLGKIIARGKGAKARMRAPETPERRTARTKAAGIVAVGLGIATLGATAAPLAALGGKALIGSGLIATLAPETTSRVLSIKGAPEVIAGGVVGGPVGALVVGAEKGTSILGDILGIDKEKILLALGITGIGAAGALGAADLLKESEEEIEKKIRKAAKKLSKKRLKELEEQFAIPSGALTSAAAPPVGGIEQQPLPPQTQELGKEPSGKRRKRRQEAPRQTISQSVRININHSQKYLKQRCYI